MPSVFCEVLDENVSLQIKIYLDALKKDLVSHWDINYCKETNKLVHFESKILTENSAKGNLVTSSNK